MERKVLNNGYSKEPAKIPKSILKQFSVEVEELYGRKVWTLSPKKNENNSLIIFLHGGAYYANITQLHWRLVEKLIISTNAIFIVPDYPLAPESTCINTYQFLDAVYAKLISKYPSKQTVFMGDSAGGGLALGYAQKIRNEDIKQPNQIILISPWLDVSMTNPEMAKYDKLDKVLSINGLKIAGKNYSGEMNVTDFWVSPIYGNFTNLGRISIFIGTNEVLIADARKFKHLLEVQHIDFNYFEYSGMFHDWVVVTGLKETKDVLIKIKDLF
ncbi:MAG: alpha/beta hydrolase [Bacteroidetes bacterium HGW-Bacteroidetes-15]|nr:MAG: alpha/beta hydrolase [Bacteroidetes bacterium HGW-Bacteroidetes-15]